MEDQIDVLQRNFLRRILGIKWPEKMSNTELYTRTQVAKLSQVILKRRLRWYGHMQRLDDNTPARQALKEALRPVNKPQGRPKTTWLKLVRNNLIDAGIQHYYSIDLVNLNDTHFHQEIHELAHDRDSWRITNTQSKHHHHHQFSNHMHWIIGHMIPQFRRELFIYYTITGTEALNVIPKKMNFNGIL